MLKLVKYIDYKANYTYSPPEADATIQTEKIQRVIPIARENTRRPFDDIVRVIFKDGSWMDVIGKPADFIEIESAK